MAEIPCKESRYFPATSLFDLVLAQPLVKSVLKGSSLDKAAWTLREPLCHLFNV
jgi:hypothetical protein